MGRLYFLTVLMLCFNSCSTAQESNCNRTLRYNNLKSKPDSAFCIHRGFYITDIYEKDLNMDGYKDKIVRSQRVKLLEADTIIFSIYVQTKAGKFALYKELNNLLPLQFSNYSRTGNKFYDSLKSLYSYPTTAEVEFETNSINLTFYTDAATVKKIFFTYSIKEKTWVLTREMQWLVPPKDYEGDEKLDENGRKLEYDRAPETPMKIEDFDMLKYIGW